MAVLQRVAIPRRARSVVTLVGFPLSAWAFALRIWAAMMLALYAAFWLQLSSASSAAATVSLLALSTRGQTYQKAIYWILLTVVGVVGSIAIAGLFAQARDLFIIAYASWFGLSVYAAGLLDGNRAAGFGLCGFTVALVAVTQIDAPQNVFSAGVDRGATVAVGIAALIVVNDVFFAPNIHTGLSGKLAAMHWRVRAFALAILQGESADPIQSADLLREITALHPDITALVLESSAGRARSAAARSAAVALVATIGAARALALLPATTLPSLRRAVAAHLVDTQGEESHALALRTEHHMQAGEAGSCDTLFARNALDLVTENQRAQDAIEDLARDRRPARHVRAPIYRSRQAAGRNGLRAFLAVLISAFLFSLGGWPFASLGLALQGITVALSANTPSPRDFAAGAVVAISITALLVGVTEFLWLDGADQFPLLAISMAPSILGAALLLTVPNIRLASIGFLVLVFFPLLLSPGNPQKYDPEVYLFSSFLTIASVILLFVLLWTILPTSDALRRRWYLTSAQAELGDVLAGARSRHLDDDAMFRDADRIGQLAALQPADERRNDLRQALNIFGLAAAARRVGTALAELSGRTDGRLLEDGYSALASCNAPRLHQAAAALASAATELDQDSQIAVRAAAADLIWAAFLIDAGPFTLGFNRSASR